MFKTFLDKLGPGLMFAASSVGVSHLVQSTRAGAAYGLSALFLIILICLLKYPLFMFSAHYTAVTGETVIDGYRKLGRWILQVLLVIYVFELPFAIAGISAVSANVLISSLDLGINNTAGALILVCACLLSSAFGHYSLIERISRLFVALFLVCIVIGAIVSVAGNVNDYSLTLITIERNSENMLFLVALAGWMPAGVGGALGVSLWIAAKNRRLGRPLTLGEVKFDFNLNYAIIIFTACCFALLGAYTLLSSSFELGGDSALFAEQLFAIFTRSFSPWTHVIIIVGANVVLLSSLLIVVDLLPRLGVSLVRSLYPDLPLSRTPHGLFTGFVVYELISVSLILLLLFRSFTSFIDLVTSLGFLAAPIIAFLNHKLVFHGTLEQRQQPGQVLRYWNVAAVVLLTLVSAAYVYLKYFNGAAT